MKKMMEEKTEQLEENGRDVSETADKGGDRTIKKIILIGGSILLAAVIVFVGILITLKSQNTDEGNPAASSAEEETHFKSGMFYNMETGYTHALAEEELQVVREIFQEELLGVQISYEEYTALGMSLSENGYADVTFLELTDETEDAGVTILYHEGYLYYENASIPNTIWRLQKEEENVGRLENIMVKLALLEKMEETQE